LADFDRPVRGLGDQILRAVGEELDHGIGGADHDDRRGRDLDPPGDL
jgi:hypothetical protein